MQLMATLKPGQKWRLASPNLDHPSPEWRGGRPPQRLTITEVHRRSDVVLARGWDGPIDPEIFCRGIFKLEHDVDDVPAVTMYRRLPALSIQQPLAWAIIMGHCPIINMTYEAPRRIWGQYIWLHAARDIDGGAIDEVIKMGAPGVPKNLGDYVRNAIIGAIRVTKSVNGFHSPWFRGPNAWIVENPIGLETLVPCKAKGEESDSLWIARPHADMEV